MCDTPFSDADKRVWIINRRVLADDWGVLTKYAVAFKRSDGSVQEFNRETYDRGHGAVVLPYCSERGTIVLTKQFRLPAYLTGYSNDLIEACAGLLDARDPETAILKETEEEIGMALEGVEKIGAFYMSPGSVTERLHFFVAPYSAPVETKTGGGIQSEGEDISVFEISLSQALNMIDQGEIIDAKTIILIQHIALKLAHRKNFK